MEVKLGGSVVTRQSSPCQSDRLRQSKVSYREKYANVKVKRISQKQKCSTSGGYENNTFPLTRVSFVFHCNVDCVRVADEVEGWQGAVHVHFVGDDVDW